MKKLILIATSLFLSSAFADSARDMHDAKDKKWKNPITGSVHEKHTEKQKVKGPDGEAEVDVTKKKVTIPKKNGKNKVEESVDIEGSSTSHE